MVPGGLNLLEDHFYFWTVDAVIDSFKKEGEEWKASREGRRQNASRQGEELPKRGAEAENRGGAAVDDHRSPPTYSHRYTRMHTLVVYTF